MFPYVSVATGAKTVDGGDNFIKSVINNGSEYLWFGEFDSVNMVHGDNWGTAPSGASTDYATNLLGQRLCSWLSGWWSGPRRS